MAVFTSTTGSSTGQKPNKIKSNDQNTQRTYSTDRKQNDYVNRGYNILYLTILINAELTSYDYLQIQHRDKYIQ